MNKVGVRCWRVGSRGQLFVAYPEGNLGYDLICCVSCGEVYAVDVLKKVYIQGDLDVQLRGVKCMRCGMDLACNWANYPDSYLGADLKLRHYKRPVDIPEGSDSVIEFFYDVYS